MKQYYRTTLRFDLTDPAEKQAADILRRRHAKTGIPYSVIVAEALNSHYAEDTGHEQLKSEIRELIREELKQLNVAAELQPIRASPEQPAGDEPDSEELSEAFELFGS